MNDSGSIFVAERYIENGYEVVFRRQHQESEGIKSHDLTIKTCDDTRFVKNIEVKQVTSSNASKVASNIGKAFEQIRDSGIVAIYLPKHRRDATGKAFVQKGFNEAKRKNWVKGPVEVWFSDKKRFDLE